MANQLVVSSDAIADIDNAVDYYNKISYGLVLNLPKHLTGISKISLFFLLLLL